MEKDCLSSPFAGLSTGTPIYQINLAIILHIMERSKFRIGSTTSGFVGLSLGNELNYRIDIDRKYVFDTDPIKTRDYCMEILYYQVRATLDTLPCGAVYLEEAYDIHSVADFCNHLFEDEVAVCSIVKVSGGNARDLINIFANSFRRANSSGNKICVEDVLSTMKSLRR